jgi:hypothetical protein
MKKKLIFISIIALFGSCSDSRNNGCTDPYAVNFESFADYEDGSCVYTADVVFFYDAIAANELNAYTDLLWGPIDRLDYYIEDSPGTYVFVGSEYPSPAFVYTGVPNCYESTYITTPIEWSNLDNTNINYIVYGVHEALLGELETIVDEYSFNLYANECAAVPIRFLTKQKK